MIARGTNGSAGTVTELAASDRAGASADRALLAEAAVHDRGGAPVDRALLAHTAAHDRGAEAAAHDRARAPAARALLAETAANDRGRAPSDRALLAEADLDWVAAVVDVVEECTGQPWRIAFDRLTDLQRGTLPMAPRRFAAVVGAVQRLAAGRATHARAAREARGLVLGAPVFSAIERQERITAAADELAITPAALETLLWADIPRERPIELPGGRPSELEVAAFANVQLIQRALRRARSVTLRMFDDPGPLLRAAGQRGLLATASISGPGETSIEIVGPLALCHRTSVYGRALGELVPLLGELPQFALQILVETSHAIYTTHIASPVLLPSPPARLSALPYPLVRLMRELARAAPQLVITPTPATLATERGIVCPDLLLEAGEQRCYVELVGFATEEHLARKLAAYHASGVAVLLCVDAAAAQGDDTHADEVLPFDKHPDADAILRRMAPCCRVG